MLVGLGSCDWWNGGSRYNRTENRSSYDRRVYEERIARDEEIRARKAAAAARERRDARDRGDMYDIYDTPAAWLTLDYACSGALRRAQWLVCENESLGQLHRRLAMQWEAARRVASPERVSVLIAQQNAFLSERNACEDYACVSAAYYRYLDGGAYFAKPWVKPPVHYYRRKPAVKWVRHHGRACDRRGDRQGYCYRDDQGARPIHEPRREPGSCISEIGFAAASQLASRCDSVTPGLSSQCSVHNSCGGIRAQTDRGCSNGRNKPGFCRSY